MPAVSIFDGKGVRVREKASTQCAMRAGESELWEHVQKVRRVGRGWTGVDILFFLCDPRLLGCGFHHCERLCHADACGTCTAVCGKSRKSWCVTCPRSSLRVHAHVSLRCLFSLSLPAQHPCTQTCHAPASCPENEPCLAPVTLTCPCGHLRSTVPCSGTKLVLACTGECEIKKRNARLADALGISEEKRDTRGKVTYSTELVGVARGLGPKFVGVAERAFAECVSRVIFLWCGGLLTFFLGGCSFITSDRRTQVLPHMPPERRKFVHDVRPLLSSFFYPSWLSRSEWTHSGDSSRRCTAWIRSWSTKSRIGACSSFDGSIRVSHRRCCRSMSLRPCRRWDG